MTIDQLLILAVLTAIIALFLLGRWRHDMVAMAALLACVLLGLVPASGAFAGFCHPAVITVACVLILSRGLQNSGAIDLLSRHMLPANTGPTLSIAALTLLGAVLSGFMNNVGALALLMPLALQLAGRLELPAGKVLMPLAFGSILGGTTTLIGTPPNLIISGFREQPGVDGFAMFDFTRVGLPLAVAGVLFVAFVGWRLVPVRKVAGAAGFETSAYITEAWVPAESAAAGKRLYEIESILAEADAQVVGLVRNEVRVTAPRPGRLIFAGDILVIEADVTALPMALLKLGLVLEEAKQAASGEERAAQQVARATASPEDASGEDNGANGGAEEAGGKTAVSDEIALMEMVVLPASGISGRSASDLLLRTRYGINLLAVSRQGQRSMARLRSLKILPGDVLLMQGPPEAMYEFASSTGCVPLAQRDLHIPDKRKVVMSTGILVLTIVVTAVGLLPAAVAFAGGVLASMALRTVPPRTAYETVDWSVIVLLGALLPVSAAMQANGTADLIARFLLDNLAHDNTVIALGVILITTMTLTDVMNNAAIAAVMAPIGLGIATQLGVNPDTFLMAVAIGASCSFLTPIGHQNNTLILGPGGFRFSDYWRMGLPLEIVVVAVALPLLLLVWPL